VVGSERDLEVIVAAVRRTPLAALALVQLLRHGATLDAHQGLLAESLVYSTLQGGPEFQKWLSKRPAPRTARPDAEPTVLLERCGARLVLTLNRPEKRNAISVQLRDALVEGLRLAAADPSIEEVVLRGAGPAFCAGGDLDEFGTLPDPATAHAIRTIRNPARLLAGLGERVRAELHGACVGAGIELPAFAGRVVAAEAAWFQLPEVAMGLVPGAGGTVSVTRRIGRQLTAYLALSGQRIDASTALRWGLVDEIAA
jgi:enoyl-CoA hydratase/carnithine racemase